MICSLSSSRLTFVSDSFLLKVLKMMVGSNLKDTQLQQMVDKSIRLANTVEEGKVSFAEFCKMIKSTDVTKKMVVEV